MLGEGPEEPAPGAETRTEALLAFSDPSPHPQPTQEAVNHTNAGDGGT